MLLLLLLWKRCELFERIFADNFFQLALVGLEVELGFRKSSLPKEYRVRSSLATDLTRWHGCRRVYRFNTRLWDRRHFRERFGNRMLRHSKPTRDLAHVLLTRDRTARICHVRQDNVLNIPTKSIRTLRALLQYVE